MKSITKPEKRAQNAFCVKNLNISLIKEIFLIHFCHSKVQWKKISPKKPKKFTKTKNESTFARCIQKVNASQNNNFEWTAFIQGIVLHYIFWIINLVLFKLSECNFAFRPEWTYLCKLFSIQFVFVACNLLNY